MIITIEDPALVQIIDEQVKSGRFASPEEFVSRLVARHAPDPAPDSATDDDDEFDDVTAERLNHAYERGLRNEGGMTVEEARERLLGQHRNR